MDTIFQHFQKPYSEDLILFENELINSRIKRFSFHFFIQPNQDTSSCAYEILNERYNKEEQIIYVSEYVEIQEKRKFNIDFFLLCFENTIIIIEQSKMQELFPFFSHNSEVLMCATSKNLQTKIEKLLNLQLQFINEEEMEHLKDEIYSFSSKIKYKIKKKHLKEKSEQFNYFLSLIIKSISGYFIRKSYYYLNEKVRVKSFEYYDKTLKNKIINENEYITIRRLNQEYNNAWLIYHIKKEKLFALKIFAENYNFINANQLFERERKNYMKINYPLFPKYIGSTTYNSYKGIIIEYIHGYSLSDINKTKLNTENKMTIIFQIMLAIKYLHENEFIYRDLKPNNIIISENYSIVIIDFDRMISKDQISYGTMDFQHSFIAPEITNGNTISNKTDIYSLGKIIDFVFSGNNSNEYLKMKKLSQKCTNLNSLKRPNIYQLITDFYYNFLGYISLNDKFETIPSLKHILLTPEFYDPIVSFNLGIIYLKHESVPRDINKSIYYFTLSANKNYVEAQFMLGLIYKTNEYVTLDINKSIFYFTSAANQNHAYAQYELGIIYINNESDSQNINKSIHYFTLAANQNCVDAQYRLGMIYLTNKYVPRNMIKSIYYLILASNQNYADAQFELGLIYINNKYVPQNMNKSIHYFTLAANNNNSDAQFNLGLIYLTRKYVPQDINKSIYYFTLAANQNHANAQFELGIIYLNYCVPRDINKSIHYLTLAADHNIANAQFNLGIIYYKGLYCPQDINKGIYYFSLAANQNHSKSQFNLGMFYLLGKNIPKDIKKSVHYLKLAANNNISEAQFSLGMIYLEKKLLLFDINKAIHYLTLAANQKNYKAQYWLGIIFLKGIYIPRDVSRSIYYFLQASEHNYSYALLKLGLIYITNIYLKMDINISIEYLVRASDQNNADSQLILGCIYDEAYYVQRDINKAIHFLMLAVKNNNSYAQLKIGHKYLIGEYFDTDINKAIFYYKMSANQGNSDAQADLGIIYSIEKYVPIDMNIAIYYFSLASEQNNILASYLLGFFYFKGYNSICRNIDKAIHYFKIGSSFNHQYSKNNLGVIYKNIKQNAIAIEYFKEAINQKNDILSMFNLGQMYLYGHLCNADIDKSINFLLKSSENGFNHSKVLLCLALMKKIQNIDLLNIKNEIKEYGNQYEKQSNEIYEFIHNTRLDIDSIYEFSYSMYKDINFVYDEHFNIVKYSEFMENNKDIQSNIKKKNCLQKNINESFYDGFLNQ